MLAFKYNARLCNLLTSFNHRLAPLLIISVVQNVPFLICCVLGGGARFSSFCTEVPGPGNEDHPQLASLVNQQVNRAGLEGLGLHDTKRPGI